MARLPLATPKTDLPKRRRRRRRGLGVILFALIAYGSVACYQWLNTPAAQQRIVAWINRHTSWEIRLDRWEWRLLSNTFTIVDLSLHHRTTGHHLQTDRLFLHYSPWGLPAGRFKIRRCVLDNVVADVAAMPPPKKERKKLELKKLFVLQNLTIESAVVNGAQVSLPGARHLSATTIRASLKPAILSDVRLAIQTDEINFRRKNQEWANIDRVTFAGTTDLQRWVDTAPFVNAAKGALTLQQGRWRAITVSELNSTLQFDHSRFGMDDLVATVNGKVIQGSGYIDLEETAYAAKVAWPEPMAIPELLGENRLFLTAGSIQGAIALEGTGFDLAATTGKASINLTQVPAVVTTIPAQLKGSVTWRDGVFTPHDLALKMGDGQVQVTGSLNVPDKRIALQFRGARMPLDGVFGRFADDDFHPLSGLASVDGTFTGWARDYLLDLTVDGAPTRYYDIIVEQVHTRTRLTYSGLTLTGQILQGGRPTGQCDLAIAYGPKVSAAPRAKQIRMQARLDGHDLAPSLAAYYLKGTGRGSVTLTGSPQHYRATGEVAITDGAFNILPLKRLTTKIEIVPKLITYSGGTLELQRIPPIDLPHPLKMALAPGSFRLTGAPRPGVSIDLSYRTADRFWTVHNIQYTDPDFTDRRLSIQGNGVSGRWNLGVRGTGNLALLEYLPAAVREATGPIAMDLRLTGPLEQPAIQGTATLRQATLLLRALPYHLEAIDGTLRFQGDTIRFDPVQGRIGEGAFALTGSVRHAGLALAGYDIALQGTNFHFATADHHFRAEIDGAVTWRGDRARSLVAGDVTILDAKYDRDFRVLEQVTGGISAARAELRKVREGWETIGLRLRIRNTGDIVIRNNAADVVLRADTIVTGTMAHPQVRGAIEVTEGKLHYLGLKFDITHGLVEFHAPFAHPYIEMTGEKEVREFLVQMTLRGPVDNLNLDLTSTPGLERKDVLALLAFGATQEELRTAQFGAQIGPSVFLEQVGKLVERPIAKLTGLDVVRVETTTGRGANTGASRLYLGKRISDRLAVEFVTGVNEQSSEQGFQVEYNITDYLLLKAAQPAGEQPRINASVRFRER